MANNLRIKLFLTPGAHHDLEQLNSRARKNPHGPDEALLEATILMLHRLNGRRHPTKPLDFDPRFGDLSECETTYVGADPNAKPPLRIVTRDLPPKIPGGVTRREVLAIGAREHSKVYTLAGERVARMPSPAPRCRAPLQRSGVTPHSLTPTTSSSSMTSPGTRLATRTFRGSRRPSVAQRSTQKPN